MMNAVTAGTIGGIAVRIGMGLLLRKVERTLEQIDWWRIGYETVFGIIGALAVTYTPLPLPVIGTYAHNLPNWLRAGIGAICGVTLFNVGSKRVWKVDDILRLPTIQFPNLNPRQQKAIALIRIKKSISNDDYQSATGATDRTATRDLEVLAKKGVLKRTGNGRGIRYTL